MSVVLFSNFHFDFDINAVVSSKVSLDATLLAILTKNGTLRIVYLPEKETDSIEITGDVIRYL